MAATLQQIKDELAAMQVLLTKVINDVNSYPTPTPIPTPTPTPTPTGESADGTSVLAGSTGVIVDSLGNKWSLMASAASGWQVACNGNVDASTSAVTQLYYGNHTVFQTSPNASSISTPGWWSWTGTGWVDANPQGTPAPTPTPTPTPTPIPAANTVSINLSQQTGYIVYPSLFGSSMAADAGSNSPPFAFWSDPQLQNAARNIAGFGMPGMHVRINAENNLFGSGGPDFGSIDRICTHLPKIIDPATATFSVGLGGQNFSIAPAAFGDYTRQTAQRFIANGLPCKQWEVWNEVVDAVININTYAQCFNAAADALRAIDPSYLVVGPVQNYMSGGNIQALAQQAGSRLSYASYHSYPSNSNEHGDVLFQRAISRGTSDAAGCRSGLRAGGQPNCPASLGEFNIDTNGNNPGMANVEGAVFNLLYIHSAFTADPLTKYGAIWDWCGDSYFGLVIVPSNNPGGFTPYTVVPVGYALKNCRQYMPGKVVSSAVANDLNLKCLATINGSKASVLLINYSVNTNYPIRITGLTAPTITYTEVSKANPKSVTQTVSLASLANITIPAMSVVTLTG